MLKELYEFAKNPLYNQDTNKQFKYRFRKLVKLLALAISFSILLLMVASTIQSVFGLEIGKHAIDDLFEDNSPLAIFMLAVFVAPFLEELIFRGPLAWFRNSDYFNFIFYSFTVCFGFVHITNFELTPQVWLLSPLLVAPQISVGFVLGFIRIKFGLLWSMVLHASYNLILIFPLVIMKFLDIQIE
ncbi:CPBP family intramembrane glutamic endopeptidase [Maribacter sp. X9]|uniref:CPBP family intramembrane glutamic endopeptidase n=1 Tax=Maribacter sp. X9 TaxID=3402159 RepID=UPI003AF38E64